jgi:hypothetical protein
LLAGDAAIKVFTDSLLSNALMVSDVSEDQKSNMMNFMSPERIQELFEEIKGDIVLDDETKKQYAAIMGYEYDVSKKRFLKDGQEV